MKILKFNLRLLAITFALTSCGNGQATNGNNIDSIQNIKNMPQVNNLRETRKYEDSTNYDRAPLLIERLAKNGYTFPIKSEFRNSILKIFKIDIDTATIDDIATNYSYYPDGSGYDRNGFIIFKKDMFVVYENVDTHLDSLRKYTPTRDNDIFFHINRYLFNNGVDSRYILAKKQPSQLQYLMEQLSYPLNDSVITDIYFKNPDIYYKNGASSDIFCNFNNHDKIIGIKEKMLIFLALQYPNMFDKCADFVLYQDIKGKEQNDYYNEFVNDRIKYYCWAYILNTYYVTLNESGMVDAFFVTRGKDDNFKHTFYEFRKYDYFGFKELKDYCDYIETLTPEKVASGKFDN